MTGIFFSYGCTRNVFSRQFCFFCLRSLFRIDIFREFSILRVRSVRGTRSFREFSFFRARSMRRTRTVRRSAMRRTRTVRRHSFRPFTFGHFFRIEFRHLRICFGCFGSYFCFFFSNSFLFIHMNYLSFQKDNMHV